MGLNKVGPHIPGSTGVRYRSGKLGALGTRIIQRPGCPIKIAIGSDHGGFKLKEKIKNHLYSHGVNVEDLGTVSEQSVDYPDIGRPLAVSVAERKYGFGILVCGTGIGMSLVANKVPGIRAALCHDLFTATMARQHNDAQILVLGGRVLKVPLALKMVDTFLTTEFEGGRHLTRIQKIEA